MMKEILLKVDDNIFGLKAAGICLCNSRVLLKRSKKNTYSFPGGNVAFNEASKDTLIRKFLEEANTDILISDLKYVSEDFLTVKGSPCHEICFYYKVTLLDKKLLKCDSFNSFKNDDIFQWIPLSKINSIKMKSENAEELINNIFEKEIRHLSGNTQQS